MADTEFEQFRRYFDRLPQYLKAPAYSYTLVHDINLDDTSSSPPNTSTTNDAGDPTEETRHNTDTGVSSASSCSSEHAASLTDQESLLNEGEEEDETTESVTWRRASTTTPLVSEAWVRPISTELPPVPPPPPAALRRRRKLPEIPKNKKSSVLQLSLADELGQVTNTRDRALLPESVQMALRSVKQPVGAFQLRGSGDGDEFSSPESVAPLYQSLDADSGHSTTNSPDGPASLLGGLVTRRPASTSSSTSGVCCNCGGAAATSTIDVPSLGLGGAVYRDVSRLVATHRGLHKFVPRHKDEIEVEIGDPVYVQRECDDLWCEGVNLRTGRQGSFPSAYAVDLEYREFDPEAAGNEASGSNVENGGGQRDRFLLDYLGSVESLHYKGNAVLCQAVRRITLGPPPLIRAVILEVSDMGIRMLGRDRLHENKTSEEEIATTEDDKALDYFYSLKNVSFCGFHPRDQRFLGFITKHPQRQRFACHVFRGDESMRPVAETIGRAFERFYQKFIETAYPTEDIYIE